MGKSSYPAHCVIHEDTKAACCAVTGADFHVMWSSCWVLQCKFLMSVFSFSSCFSPSFLFPPTPSFFILKKNRPVPDTVKRMTVCQKAVSCFPFKGRRSCWCRGSISCRVSGLGHYSHFGSDCFRGCCGDFLWIIGCLEHPRPLLTWQLHLPTCDTQTCLQTFSNVPLGTKLPLIGLVRQLTEFLLLKNLTHCLWHVVIESGFKGRKTWVWILLQR